MTSTEESKLTVELLFEESFKPDPATNFKFAPDDSCITFLAKNATNPNELSIWRFDLAKHTTQEWLCAPASAVPRCRQWQRYAPGWFVAGVLFGHWRGIQRFFASRLRTG